LTPTLTTFDPNLIPYQMRVINDIRVNFDYGLGVHEILLSGAVGSAKSTLLAHIAVTHCLLYPKARFLIGRESMPQLKDTLLNIILDHIDQDVAYVFNRTRGHVEFPNGSRIICYSWHDKRYKKVRSYELSGAAIEELTENDDQEFYKEIKMRIGRASWVPERLLISATNPDSPAHWAYDYFIASQSTLRHVYYSVTAENPFLPANYAEAIKETLTEREAQRMLYGEWVEIMQEVVYYAYDPSLSLIEEHKVNEFFPIIVSFDFNIGMGKPMSCVFLQYIDNKFIFYDEIVVHGANTNDIMVEAFHRGLFEYDVPYIIRGDATGKAKSTNYNKSDYDVINDFLRTARKKNQEPIEYQIDVSASNPPVRKRHLVVNGCLKNAFGKTRINIVKSKCKVLQKGFRLTKLKKGGSYIEDDSNEYQHITTAAGYAICQQIKNEERGTGIKRKII